MVNLCRYQGKHELKINLESFGKTCGILPLGTNQAFVTTTGLEWDLGPTSCESSSSFGRSFFAMRGSLTISVHQNLDMYPTSLAEAVSTSNHLIQEDVTIETDCTVVWTMEVRGGGD